MNASVVCTFAVTSKMDAKSSRGGDKNGSNGVVRRRITKQPPPCRYGAECRNIGKCKFLHSTSVEVPYDDGSTATKSATQSSPSRNKKKPGPKHEQNDEFKKMHALSASDTLTRINTAKNVNATTVGPEKNSTERNGLPRDRSKIQCRYGMSCRNKKCPFYHHPATVCDTPVTCHETVDSPATVTEPSSPGPRRQRNQSGESSPVTKSAEKETPNSFSPTKKIPSKKKCRWGSGCRNRKCLFLHPSLDNEDEQKSGMELIVEEKRGFSSAAVVMALKNYELMGSNSGWNVDASKSGMGNTHKATVHASRPMNDSTTHLGKSSAPPILPPSPDSHRLPQIRSDESPSLWGRYSSPHTPSKGNRQSPSLSTHEPDVCRLAPQGFPPSPPSDWLARNNIHPFTPNAESTIAAVSTENRKDSTPSFSRNTERLYFAPSPLNSVESNQSKCTQPPGTTVGTNLIGSNEDDKNPDAEWLFEVLGLNDLISAATETNSVVAETPLYEQNFVSNEDDNMMGSKFVDALPETKPEPLFDNQDSSISNSVGESPKVLLMSEAEVSLSRRAALELRLESQGKSRNPELLSNLLFTCRSKHEAVKAALEQSMDTIHEETGSAIDEANVLALLDLNELLLSSINVAEVSMKKTSKIQTQTNSTNSENEGRKALAKKNDSSSWTSVGNKLQGQNEATKNCQSRQKNAGDGKVSATKKATKAAVTASVSVEKKCHQETSNRPLPDERTNSSKAETELHHEVGAENAKDYVQQEKEKMARMMEEARQKMAAARERKANKKSKKLDKWIREQEELKKKRTKLWEEIIAKENDYSDLIQKLIVAEFLRQSKSRAMGLTAERVKSDAHASELIAKESREALHTIYGDLKCRVEVAGSDRKDLNARTGTLRYWDKEREKFCVGLDTKKSSDSDVHFICPENLEMIRPSKPEKKPDVYSYDINVAELLTYGGVKLGLSFTLNKSHIVNLGSSESTDAGLKSFCALRDEEERQAKVSEEEEKKREEEDRKRRAARKAQEQAAWDRRREQMHKEKEDLERMKKEWTKQRRENGRVEFDHFSGFSYEYDGGCQCPKCRCDDTFYSNGGAFFFNIGGMPFRVPFDHFDSNDEDSFFDDFDETWERKLEEEKQEETRKQANILGVSHDADERTIKLAYHKMALKYHPDKWRSDSDHGMTKDEAENRFKLMQSAYDHLMSNFDD
ncbi:hypothetical protein ACHAXS_013867 [Conticribra weissflogii]